MNIPKAIEILQRCVSNPICEPPTGRIDALSLGIEALKAVGFVRTSYPGALTYPLPGETEGDTNEHS